jgi:very-short-patch-repair endonuclease
MIETRLRSGRLQRRHQGVYTVGHGARAELTRETEALLACPDGALLSHEAAAALWRLRDPLRDHEPTDVLIPGTQTPRHPGVLAHRTSILDPRDARIERGLPTTSPARTFVDTAGNRTESELERGLDDALRRNLLRLPQLEEAIDRVGGNRKCAGLLRVIVADRRSGTGLSRSDAELIAKRLITAAELPQPDLNANLGRYEPDMVWWEQRVIVEVDSWDWHGGRWSFEADRKRDATLIADGWIILRFTARQIRREPYRVVAQIAAALAHRMRFAA